jgi:hypothetical protein
MKLKIDKEKINRLSPEDALPLIIRVRNFILGKKKPDGFTRVSFLIALFIWLLLTAWNAISYFVVLSADIIYENKGFSVKEIIRIHGRKMGFNGQEFLDALTNFYFINLFIWGIVFVGLVFMYRKMKVYPLFIFGGLIVHFAYMFFILGLQYFLEDISFFDKICYVILLGVIIIHSWLMNKEKAEISANNEREIIKE